MDAIEIDTEDVSASPRRIPEQRLSVSLTSRHRLRRFAVINALPVFATTVINTISRSVINAEPERQVITLYHSNTFTDFC
jgi:hypothetical protein